MHTPRPLHQVIPATSNKYIGQQPAKYSDELTAILGERNESLIELVENYDEVLTSLLMAQETKFGQVSKTRKKRKKRSDSSRENRAQLGQGRGHGKGRSKFPQHPRLGANAAQRYAGMSDDATAVPGDDPDLEDSLMEVISEEVKNNPSLELSLDLAQRIKLYNERKLQNNLTHTNTPRLDRR